MDLTLKVDVLAGITGGVASVFVGQPLDTVKVKMQLFPSMYGNMFSCFLNTVRQKGFRGLYAGILPALASNCADNAIMFGTYGQCQQIVASMVGVGDSTDLNYIGNAAAGSMASFFSALVLCPTELVKIRLQGGNNVIDVKLQSHTVSQVLNKIWKSEGFKGFYRGLGSTIARECIGGAVFFGSYERARELLKPVGKRKENCDAINTMGAGSLAGIFTWLIIYPIDVIKSRVQVSGKKSDFQLIKNEILSQGSQGLYSGLLPTLVKTIPVAAVLLFSVEFSKPFYREYLPEITDSLFGLSHDNTFSICDFVSGLTAGIVSTLVGHPMDTVKVVQQVTNNTVLKTIRNIYNQDKLIGYFRGMMFPIFSTSVANSVFFGTYGNVMRLIQIHRGDNDTNDNIDVRFCCDADNLHKYWHMDVFISGCVAGFVYALINTPVEVIKTLLQARNASTLNHDHLDDSKKAEPLKTTRAVKLVGELYKLNGIRSLYRGGTLLFIRDVPSMGIYVLSYEHLSSVLNKLLYSETKIESVPKHVQLVAGGVAGVISWVMVLPIDVIKSKIITDSLTQPLYKGAWDCAVKTYNEGGAKSFLRGFSLICIRAFPVNGLMFVTYEMLINSCRNDKVDQLINTPVESKWM